MKILSIGNSFSQDAHKWLHQLAKLNGVDIQTANLYIGGCSLETHWKNACENNALYKYEINGNKGTQYVSIEEALKSETWDIVTLQQVSHKSGVPESYEPYLSSLANMVRELQPDAKLYFHQTWAYEIDSEHSGFANYNRDQAEMFDRIKQTSRMAAKTIRAAVIPAGEAIQKVRETVPEFDYKNGGLSLCRDGYHLSLDYGRYAAAAIWLHTVVGMEVKITEFEDFDPALLMKITDVVNGK